MTAKAGQLGRKLGKGYFESDDYKGLPGLQKSLQKKTRKIDSSQQPGGNNKEELDQ